MHTNTMTVLNAEQMRALSVVKAGRNLFLTGAGGTGKSHTIHAICEWAQSAGIRYAVTALTGCAALLLGQVKAKTLHSWAGVGLARESPAELAEAVRRNKRAARRWVDTQLLIVDEVSMMTGDFLEKLDLVARRVRRKPTERFGGVQIVFAGDFCQLPPVTRGEDLHFVFESAVWGELVDETVELWQIQRQSDPVFQQLLNEARMGRLTSASVEILEKRMGLAWQDNEIRPTLLFSRNAEVDEINRRNMAVLEGARHTYEAETVVMEKTTRKAVSWSAADAIVEASIVSPSEPAVRDALERLDTDAPYMSKLEICEGAQVMLLTNLDQDKGLVNGSRGVVTGFSLGGLPRVKFLSYAEEVIVDRANWWLTDYDGIGRAQIPLRVAYAITIHKSQGATLDSALVDIGSSTFEWGQAYVALSRVRSLEGLYVWKLDPRKVRAHPTVVTFYEALAAKRGLALPPPVLATASDPWSLDGVSPAWRAVMEPYLESPAGRRLAALVRERMGAGTVAPAGEDIFAALRACPDPAAVRVVILGQDPYHTAGLAHGLAFSVRPSVVKLPPSLVNIYKELAADLDVEAPSTGCLDAWAAQGVLLLNDVLTVTLGAPQSHAGLGWEELTQRLLGAVLTAAPHVVVIAWGRFAQKKLDRKLIGGHTVLTAPHPSPLSAHTGFFGSRPFSQANAALVAHGQTPIQWALA